MYTADPNKQGEFLTTGGEFAAQIFIQTWFLRRKRGLPPPKDRRCINFSRLVIMCCDLARLGDYELLVNLWACVLHRCGPSLVLFEVREIPCHCVDVALRKETRPLDAAKCLCVLGGRKYRLLAPLCAISRLEGPRWGGQPV